MSELWRRLGFVALALLIYRIGTHIPIPGINPEQVAALFQETDQTILQYFNLWLLFIILKKHYSGYSK